MKFHIAIFLLLGTSYSYSQVDTIFFDKNWNACKEQNATFYRIIAEKDNVFEVNDFYINNTLQMKGQSSFKDSLFKQGDFYYYNEKGNLIETTTYIDNLKQGKSTQYFDDGKVKRIIHFTDGKGNGETIYYNAEGILIGKGLVKDNYWYGKWEKYNDDGSFLTYLFYDDRFKFDEIGLKVSTPSCIWIFFDKIENETTIKYLCRPTNYKHDAIAKFSDAPNVSILIPKTLAKKSNLKNARFDYDFYIYDRSINIKNVEVIKQVPLSETFYTYFYIDVEFKSKNFQIVISVNENKFDFYKSVINEFISNLTADEKLDTISGQTPDSLLSDTIRNGASAPSFPGGLKRINRIIESNMLYPERAQKEKVGGKVLTQFVVDTLGNVENIQVVEGIRADIDSEAKRVVSLLNGWTPATKNGKKVKFRMALPLTFYPNGKWKCKYERKQLKLKKS